MHGVAMRRMQDLFEHGRFYDATVGRVFAHLRRRVLDDLPLADLPRGASVLDAGCGPGRLAMEIARQRPDLAVHGADLAAGAIELAKAMAGGSAEFVRADLADLPFPDGSFDLIVSTASYHHWDKVDQIVPELARVLKPSGVLWLYDLRPAPIGPFRDAVASAMPGRTVRESLVRTGWLPVATWRRVCVSRAG